MFEYVSLKKDGLPPLDLKKALQSVHPKHVIRHLSTRELLQGLKDTELVEEILPLLSKEQFVALCDYDTWGRDRFYPEKLFVWIRALGQISPKELFRKFRSLDEEYQVLSLAGFVRLYDREEWEAFSQERQDVLRPLPGEELFLEILSQDPWIQETVEMLCQAGFEEDMDYLLKLLGESSYCLVAETEELLRQFRVARLEEDGFVTREEAMSFFSPVSLPKMSKIADGELATTQELTNHDERSFLDRCLQDSSLSKSFWEDWGPQFLHLLNGLGSYYQLEMDDHHRWSDLIKKAKGLLSMGLEALCQGQVSQCSAVLTQKHPKVLFQTGFTLLHEYQKEVLHQLEDMDVLWAAKLKKAWMERKYAKVQDLVLNSPIKNNDIHHFLYGLFSEIPLLMTQTKEGQIVYNIIDRLSHLQKLKEFSLCPI